MRSKEWPDVRVDVTKIDGQQEQKDGMRSIVCLKSNRRDGLKSNRMDCRVTDWMRSNRMG
jgi:hypothetical protein